MFTNVTKVFFLICEASHSHSHSHSHSPTPTYSHSHSHSNNHSHSHSHSHHNSHSHSNSHSNAANKRARQPTDIQRQNQTPKSKKPFKNVARDDTPSINLQPKRVYSLKS